MERHELGEIDQRRAFRREDLGTQVRPSVKVALILFVAFAASSFGLLVSPRSQAAEVARIVCLVQGIAGGIVLLLAALVRPRDRTFVTTVSHPVAPGELPRLRASICGNCGAAVPLASETRPFPSCAGRPGVPWARLD